MHQAYKKTLDEIFASYNATSWFSAAYGYVYVHLLYIFQCAKESTRNSTQVYAVMMVSVGFDQEAQDF